MVIADAANTWDLALFILIEKEYEVVSVGDEETSVGFMATKGDQQTFNTTPLSLLGSVLLMERQGKDRWDNWKDAFSYIDEKGYVLSRVFGEKGEEDEPDENGEFARYSAVKEEDIIFADDPFCLLGLINIVELYGENWRSVKTGNLFWELLEITVDGVNKKSVRIFPNAL